MDNQFNIINQAFKLSKQETTVEEAYQMVYPLFKQNELATTYHLTFAWIAYRRLKARYKQIGSVEARRMLAMFLSLQTERPSVLHSSLLYLAIAIKKEYADFQFLKFLRMWGTENFREDDWMPFQGEKATVMSLAQKTIYQAMSELKTSNDPESLVIMSLLISQAVRRYPQTAEHHRQLGMILAKQGLREEAINAYKKALLCENKFYFWSELATLTNDLALRKAALCMALYAQSKDDYVGAIHLQLAGMLIAEGDFQHALTDLNKVYATYSRQKWTIPAEYFRLMTAIPQGTQPARRDKAWLEQMAQPATDFLLDDLPVQVLFVENYFVSRKGQEMAALKSPEGNSIVIPKKKLKSKDPIEPGDFIKARIKTDESHKATLMGIAKASDKEITTSFGKIITVEGTIQLKRNAAGKPFAFVKKCYVGAHLLKGLTDGQTVKVKAIQKEGRTTAITSPFPLRQ